MKNNLFVLPIILLSLLTYSSNAQEANSKNYVLSNISYAFFGTGDVSGSAIGVAYHHMFFDKFGANISYSKATAHSSGLLDFYEDYTIENVNTSGENIAFNVSLYNSANVGLTYRVTANSRHELLAGAGLNYKSLKYNYPSFVGQSEDVLTIYNYDYNSSREAGFYVSLDYLFFVTESFSVGIHGAYENTPNVVTSAGLSLGCRF